MSKHPIRIAIIGGGIGGMAAGLTLWRAGFDIALYEQAPQFGEVGAGIQLGPDTTRLLFQLGLERHLREVVAEPTALEIRRWQSGDLLTRIPLNHGREQQQETPYWTIHRADLHTILREHIPSHALHLNKRCMRIEQENRRVTLTFADGSTENVDLVIGADGIHSVVRQSVSQDQARFSRTCAYRGLIPRERLPNWDFQRTPRIIVWLGPGKELVCYPISSGRLLNIVCVVPDDDWMVESWNEPGAVEDLAKAFGGGDERVEQIINVLGQTRRWALYDREPLGRWNHGHITLLGDAAHPMLPHKAQGAGQAIEDAVVLAQVLQGAEPSEIEQRLDKYEALRRPRASQHQRDSRQNGRAFLLPDGQAQEQRDTALRRSRTMADVWKALKLAE
ncbi:MAG: FAD-dependent monooxygenase [Ktedonobacteraceae bacterium]|nr:FAD-dependent monooxygenase [Ktedonobacteraceae bacterium]